MASISSSITLQVPERNNVKVYAVVIKSHSNIRIWNIPVNLDHTILTTVTKHPDVITRWIEGVYADLGNTIGFRHVGMEVEIDFVAARARTVQFCVGNRCLVIQLEENQPCPPSLLQFMHDQNKFAFVSSQAALKIKPLEKALSGIQGTMMVIIDLWNYMEPIFKKWGIINSFRPANEGVVDLDWGGPNAYQLSPPQVHYACIDAFLNIHIANCLWNVS